MRKPDVRRFSGAAAGAATSGLVAAVAWWLGFDAVAGIAAVGAPIGFGIGWWLGPRAATRGQAIATWLTASVGAICLAIAYACAMGVASLVAGEEHSDSAYVIYLLPLVIAYAFLFGSPVVLPVAGAWTLLMRLVAARPRAGWTVLTAMGAVAVVLGLGAFALGPAIEARKGDDSRRAGSSPLALAVSRTEIRWTVRNCAAWPYAVAIEDHPLIGGPVNLGWVAAPERESSGSTVVEPGWTIGIEPDPGAPLPRPYLGPKGVLHDVPARVVSVTVEVGPRGEWGVGTTVDGTPSTSSLGSICPSAG